MSIHNIRIFIFILILHLPWLLSYEFYVQILYNASLHKIYFYITSR